MVMELLSAELLSDELEELVDSKKTREFLNSAEFACLEETCRIAFNKLPYGRQNLSELVAHRCLDIGQLMGLSGSDLIRIEIAARVHRLGESFISDSICSKSFIDMTEAEFQAYRHYPMFSAVRLSQHVSREFYEILLNHRGFYSGAGLLNIENGEKISLSSRILCVATEYEELLRYVGDDLVRQDTLQRRMIENVIGRYDSSVVDALMLTVAAENAFH